MNNTIPVINHSHTRLDYLGWRAPLDVEIKHQWRVSCQVHPSRTRIFGFGEGLVIIDGTSGVIQVGPQQPQSAEYASWERLHADVEAVSPGTKGSITIACRNGSVLTWAPGMKPAEIWKTQEEDPVANVLTPDVLLLRNASISGRSTVAVDLNRGVELWRRPFVPLVVLPCHDSFFSIERLSQGPVVRIDARSGKEIWTATIPQILDLIGVVDERLWVTRMGGQLIALDVAKGNVCETVEVNEIAIPSGVLDERGFFHQCNGITYHITDLHDGSVIGNAELSSAHVCPSTAAGQNALLTDDDRILFFDESNRLFEVSMSNIRYPRLVWESESQIVGAGITNKSVYALESSGKLHCLQKNT